MIDPTTPEGRCLLRTRLAMWPWPWGFAANGTGISNYDDQTVAACGSVELAALFADILNGAGPLLDAMEAAQARVREAEAERDAARAEVARLRPVVEAARRATARTVPIDSGEMQAEVEPDDGPASADLCAAVASLERGDSGPNGGAR